MTVSGSGSARDATNAATTHSVELPAGTFVIERYVPDRGGVQWLAQVVGADGELWLMSAENTRRAALQVIDSHGTSAARNAHD